MQDGATSHTSISTKEYLKKKCNVLKKWPPNSPDLNPIEHLWGIMDKKISDETPKTKNQLIKKCRQVWNNIEWEIIENLCNSMEKRLRLVIELKGECINGFLLI
ncbi:transposable element tc1 transposase [Anaeramoeba flamelloides]|uniref:Transposable element tc1 transposase n=1 Tax=Anaeramoeba flamelloides TaxID=1746091 RepID=A0AAV7Y2U6_9EUKA|nr:transposable element tc1 transposase [Anaeramoeba flamelloides]